MKRRAFLKGVGAVAVVAAGGLAWRAHDQGVFSPGVGPGYEPWTDWRSDAAPGPLALVRAGIL
ncbi:MAG TPA: twin-arginine translocation signal domain-containing protein, partial [Methylomirabilota bacterium]|nr:twin-arginine translocation signal domain-containing protein [Methylomirabilota bacterium]